MKVPATDVGLAALLDATFRDLPLFFDVERQSAIERIASAGYRQTRQRGGLPMAEKLVGGGEVIGLFSTPDMPLPKAKWLALGAADWFDRLSTGLLDRGFRLLPPGRLREGMEVATFAASGDHQIGAVTIMRLSRSADVLLAAAAPRTMVKGGEGCA